MSILFNKRREKTNIYFFQFIWLGPNCASLSFMKNHIKVAGALKVNPLSKKISLRYLNFHFDDASIFVTFTN